MLMMALFVALRPLITFNLFNYAAGTQDFFLELLPFAAIPLFIFINKDRLRDAHFKTPLFEALLFEVLALFFFFASAKWFADPNWPSILRVEFILNTLRGLSLVLALFGTHFIRTFLADLLIIGAILLPIELSALVVDSLWPYSSRITLAGLQVALPLTGLPYEINTSTFLVRLKDFRVSIGAPCAGLQSLLTFSGLYLMMILLLRAKKIALSWKRVVLFLIGGCLIVYILNTLRVLLILLIGVLYSEEFAITTFHSSIGSILFLIFFVLYIKWALPRVLKSDGVQ